MINISIREATETEFLEIERIWMSGIRNSFDVSNEEIVNRARIKFRANFFARTRTYNFWVAIGEDNKILGWQALLPVSNNPFREKLLAESSTYIAPDQQGNGIGKKLLEHAIAEAAKSNIEYLLGFVSQSNTAAKQITHETGWITLGELPAHQTQNEKFKKLVLIRPV